MRTADACGFSHRGGQFLRLVGRRENVRLLHELPIALGGHLLDCSVRTKPGEICGRRCERVTETGTFPQRRREDVIEVEKRGRLSE